jgi:hypothetical protein
MLNTPTTLIALLSAAVLTACGGGGGDGTDARTKYVGTWTSGCDFENTDFYIKSTITLRTQGSADLVGDYSELYYTDSNCTVRMTGANASDSWTTTYTFVGSTKTLADGKVVDKVRATVPEEGQANVRVQAILYTADNKLWGEINEPDVADSSENVDSEGFPNTLDANDYLTKVTN